MLPLLVLLAACLASVVAVAPVMFPVSRSASCSFSYTDAFGFGRINPTHNWMCTEQKYQSMAYPKKPVDDLLLLDQYFDANDYLKITSACYDPITVNAQAFNGDNTYYKWESMCKMIRTPVKMVWAKPTGAGAVAVPPGLMGLNNGYLPCHVLEGQFLYNAECIHPWSDGPSIPDRRMARRLKRIRWTPSKKRLCHYGYLYNPKFVCKPTGYMTRDVLVYSPDMHIIFKARINDIPTSCICATCECEKPAPMFP